MFCVCLFWMFVLGFLPFFCSGPFWFVLDRFGSAWGAPSADAPKPYEFIRVWGKAPLAVLPP